MKEKTQLKDVPEDKQKTPTIYLKKLPLEDFIKEVNDTRKIDKTPTRYLECYCLQDKS